MSGILRTLPLGRVAVEMGSAWVVGTTAAILGYLIAEGQLAEFSPFMVGGALGWFGLILIPAFLVVWIPLAAIRKFLGMNIGTGVFLIIVAAASIYAMTRPESPDPYTQPLLRMLGATGIVWIVIIFGTILLSRGRRSDAQ